MRLHKGDDDGGEPLDTWTVTRTWRDVPARTAVAAVDVSSGMPHDQVSASRVLPGMTPPLSFTREENTALLAAVSAVVQGLENATIETDLHRYYAVLTSLRTLFAEQGYAFERTTE